MTRLKTVFRSLDGILLLDKPQGLSSNQALQRARHLFRAAKGGHTGALDPLATGMLPICFGEATKIAGYLLGADKTYAVTACLGISTDTDDAEGRIIATQQAPKLSRIELRTALDRFVGQIEQRPPAYSAIKRGGEPMYRKARRGEVVQLATRRVRIERIEILALDGGQLVLRVECGSGTYIRSLIRDLGQVLGCGAHVIALRRLMVAPFEAAAMHTLEAIAARAMPVGASEDDGLLKLLLPIEAGLAGWPRLHVDSEQARRLAQGQAQTVAAEPGLAVAVAHGMLLGIVETSIDGRLRARRLFRRCREV